MDISTILKGHPIFPDREIAWLDDWQIFASTGFSVIAGEAKAGKTLLTSKIMLDACLRDTANKVIWYDLERNASFRKRLFELFCEEDLTCLARNSNFTFKSVLEKPDLLSSTEDYLELSDELSESIVVIDSLNQLQARNPQETNYTNVVHAETAFFTRLASCLTPKSALILIHHHNKAGGISGTSALFQVAENIINLTVETTGKGDFKEEKPCITRLSRNAPAIKRYYRLEYPYFVIE